jgi:hypothetical protein
VLDIQKQNKVKYGRVTPATISAMQGKNEVRPGLATPEEQLRSNSV